MFAKCPTVLTRRLFPLIILIIIFYGFISFITFFSKDSVIEINKNVFDNYRQRSECQCLRPELSSLDYDLLFDSIKTRHSLCSVYATRRGPNQRIISISIFGPKENKMFHFNRSISFLNELLNDIKIIYPENFILRIYHDNTINSSDVICPFECQNSNVDFCDMSSKLFIPPKIWRFLPAADPLVDIMMSRDLDSALTKRERAAVDIWLASNKSFHVMRDHPLHGVPMLGGMWGFRPSLNPTVSRLIYNKIHDSNIVKRYGGRGDQTFLTNEVWPKAKLDSIVHDSFLCTVNYGKKPDPFPTQRPSANETNCFIGCVRPCCGGGKMPFGECPKECRPKDHPEWNYC